MRRGGNVIYTDETYAAYLFVIAMKVSIVPVVSGYDIFHNNLIFYVYEESGIL